MDFNVEKFSYRLTVLLDEHNMSQTQLAKKIGTTNVTICRYLSGDRTPRIDVLIKICSVFNVSLDYLLGMDINKKLNTSKNDYNYNINLIAKKLFKLDKNSCLSKKQLDLIKKLLIANKEFIIQPNKQQKTAKK